MHSPALPFYRSRRITDLLAALRRWGSGWHPQHLAIVALVLLGMAMSWWKTDKHLLEQRSQVEQAARMQQAGLAAIVSENLRQVIEKAQLMGVVAREGLTGSVQWQSQLAVMLERDQVFLRFTLLDRNLQMVPGQVVSALSRSFDAQQTQSLLTTLPNTCRASAGVVLMHNNIQPITSAEQAWQVPLMLCLGDEAGTVQGYLLLTMDMGYFLSLYQDMEVGDSGSIHLLASDGSVVAAMAAGGMLSPRAANKLAEFADLMHLSGSQSAWMGHAEPRLVSYHRANHLPFTVVVSRQWQEVYAAHEANASRSWWQLSVVSVLAVLATGLLLRTMQRRLKLFNALTKADHDKQELIAQLESEKQRALDLAATDHLTGLYNRRMFHELVTSHLALARRSRKHYALLYLDLDRFKHINDTLGHHVGDALLQQVAQRLQQLLRSSDIIARMGGDEFAVLVTAMERMTDMDVLAQKLVEGLSVPYEGLVDHALQVSPSIGIAFFPRDGHDTHMLCRHADTAMYASKKAGRCCYTYYDSLLNPDRERSYRLARQLPQAIAQNQLVLHFQPKVRLEDRRVVGFEALVRWEHPELGLVYPGDFIPLAEENGHIEALGDWVMQACCEQIAAWRLAGLPVVPIAFNVSPMQLRDTAFPVRVATCLQRNGVRGSDIEVEITESSLVEPVGLAVRVLSQLQNMGVQIGLDDFGTGFSSLSQIRALPINTIKLDKSFVNELRSSKEAGVLVTSIITLAHNLKLQVVAEGVELMDQLVYLKTAGCDVVQGYFLSRPVPAAKAQIMLQQEVMEVS